MKLRVTLNGTDKNPFHRLGMTQNPFPQLGRREYDRHILHLAKLAADPIPDADYIRRHLQGWSTEFVELCCRLFSKGEIVTFEVEWPDE